MKENETTIQLDSTPQGLGVLQAGAIVLKPIKEIGGRDMDNYTVTWHMHTCKHTSYSDGTLYRISSLSLSRAQGKAHNLSPALSGPFSIVRNL